MVIGSWCCLLFCLDFLSKRLKANASPYSNVEVRPRVVFFIGLLPKGCVVVVTSFENLDEITSKSLFGGSTMVHKTLKAIYCDQSCWMSTKTTSE